MAHNGTSVHEKTPSLGGHSVISESPTHSMQRGKRLRGTSVSVSASFFFFFCPLLVNRKSNNQVLKENDQRPKDMGQMARHYIHQRPIRLPMTPNLRKLQKGPVGQRNPPPQEENTRVSGGVAVSRARGPAWTPKSGFQQKPVCLCPQGFLLTQGWPGL